MFSIVESLFLCIVAINIVGSSRSRRSSGSSETVGLTSEFYSAEDDAFEPLQYQINRQQKKIEDLQSVIGDLIKILATTATADDIDDLQDQIESLKTMNVDSITALRMEIEDASIIPPNLALNMAVCIGQPTGLSGMEGSTSEDLRCPPGSTESTNGFNDRTGMGIARMTDFSSIEECRDECMGRDACNSFNWSPTNENTDDCAGTTCCTIYGADDAKDLVDYPVVYCILNDEPIDPCIIGKVISYAGKLPLPDGFVIANGGTIDVNDYPEACLVFEDIYGSGEMGECVLPNLENKFIYGATKGVMGGTSNIGQCDGDDTLNL